MGKTSQPLVIWVAPEWFEHDKVKELREKGHVVRTFNGTFIDPPDLILHPKAWRWYDGQWDNLEIAIKEARKGHVKPDVDRKARQQPGNRKRPSKSAE